MRVEDFNIVALIFCNFNKDPEKLGFFLCGMKVPFLFYLKINFVAFSIFSKIIDSMGKL